MTKRKKTITEIANEKWSDIESLLNLLNVPTEQYEKWRSWYMFGFTDGYKASKDNK